MHSRTTTPGNAPDRGDAADRQGGHSDRQKLRAGVLPGAFGVGGCRGDKPQGSPEMLVGALAEVIGTAGVLRVAGFDVGGSHAGHHFGELLH